MPSRGSVPSSIPTRSNFARRMTFITSRGVHTWGADALQVHSRRTARARRHGPRRPSPHSSRASESIGMIAHFTIASPMSWRAVAAGARTGEIMQAELNLMNFGLRCHFTWMILMWTKPVTSIACVQSTHLPPVAPPDWGSSCRCCTSRGGTSHSAQRHGSDSSPIAFVTAVHVAAVHVDVVADADEERGSSPVQKLRAATGSRGGRYLVPSGRRRRSLLPGS